MNAFFKMSCLIIVLSVGHAASDNLAEYYDRATGHTLIVRQGSGEQDRADAIQFNKDFFGSSYAAIPKEDREFESLDELVDKKFELHAPFIDNNTYKFIIVENKESQKMVGYALFDISEDGKKVAFIECQANIFTYAITGLMPFMVGVIKTHYAPEVTEIYSMVRKAVPQYVAILKQCGYVPCDVLHASITDPAEYYGKPEFNQDPSFTRLKDMYQGLVFRCNPNGERAQEPILAFP